MPPPLIVCAELDDDSRELLDGLRRQHFPPERNFLGSHVTLFHHLDEPEAVVAHRLASAAATTPPLPAALGRPRNLGRGVAYGIECPALSDLRRRLADAVTAEMTEQDRRWHWPHVTVANMLPPARARALTAELDAAWDGRAVQAEGLSLWRYVGGPWEHVGTWAFTAAG